jgi:hypothetical protein
MGNFQINILIISQMYWSIPYYYGIIQVSVSLQNLFIGWDPSSMSQP